MAHTGVEDFQKLVGSEINTAQNTESNNSVVKSGCDGPEAEKGMIQVPLKVSKLQDIGVKDD